MRLDSTQEEPKPFFPLSPFQSSDESPATGGGGGDGSAAVDGNGSDGDADDGGDGTDASTSGDGGAGATDGGETTVTVAVQPDQEAMQERQAEIQSALQSGNMSQQEAQQALQEAQFELIGQVVDDYRARVAEEPALAIDDALPRFGLLEAPGRPPRSSARTRRRRSTRSSTRRPSRTHRSGPTPPAGRGPRRPSEGIRRRSGDGRRPMPVPLPTFRGPPRGRRSVDPLRPAQRETPRSRRRAANSSGPISSTPCSSAASRFDRPGFSPTTSQSVFEETVLVAEPP